MNLSHPQQLSKTHEWKKRFPRPLGFQGCNMSLLSETQVHFVASPRLAYVEGVTLPVLFGAQVLFVLTFSGFRHTFLCSFSLPWITAQAVSRLPLARITVGPQVGKEPYSEQNYHSLTSARLEIHAILKRSKHIYNKRCSRASSQI